MRIPLEISFNGLDKDEWMEDLVRTQATRLERVCDHINSCRVAIEVPQRHQSSGSGFRVRLDLTVAPGHEFVIRREAGEGDMHDALPRIIRDAFRAARRKVQSLSEMQRGDVKTHPEVAENFGVVVRLFRPDGYGFLKAAHDGREVYFHRNAVLNGNFERLEVGDGVRFVEVEGQKGPQASTVQVVDRPAAL